MPNLKRMTELFAEFDVEELIAEGAPRDEYDDEANAVAQKIMDLNFVKTKVDQAAILNGLIDVWGKSFNLNENELEKRRENLSKLATKVEEICVKSSS